MSDHLLINSDSNLIFLLCFLSLPLILYFWATKTTTTAAHKKSPPNQKITNLVFYVHDNFNTAAADQNDATSVTVAGTEGAIASSILKFGTFAAVDAPVTEGPDPNSREIGRARGFYMNSQLNGKGLHMVFSVVFTDGEFKGSSIEIQGDDPFEIEEREYSVVAGTGFFRFVLGFGIMRTEFLDINALRAVLKHDVTLKHY